MFSTLGARRAEHGARARARLAAGGSPFDPPKGEPSSAEIGRARPARKRTAGPKAHDFTLLFLYGHCEVQWRVLPLLTAILSVTLLCADGFL